MSRSWWRFLFLHFAVAAVGLALIAQALAFLLSNVPLRRDRAAELVLAVGSDPTNYRIILLGDSITRNATERYSLGAPGEVADLATHAQFGWPGEFLLLQRYLRSHQAPEHVVIAFVPSMYSWIANLRLTRYQLWNTFKEPEERQFLKTYLPDIERRDWLPAIADLQERVVEPLFSLFLDLVRPGPLRIASGWREPDPHAAVDNAEHPSSEPDDGADEGTLSPTPLNAASLHQICLLSERYGFRVHIVWPPMPKEIEKKLIDTGALGGLASEIRVIAGDHCDFGEIFDFNTVRSYGISSFRLDSIHLYGDGWEERYASDLRAYLTALSNSRLPAETATSTKPGPSPSTPNQPSAAN